VSTFGAELFREWRAGRQQRSERQRTTALELQEALTTLVSHHFVFTHVPSSELDSTPDAQFLLRNAEVFARIDALASRIESASLLNALSELRSSRSAMIYAFGSDGYEAAKARWYKAAETLTKELGKVLH